jgi:serine/threonine-protein kinase HipA
MGQFKNLGQALANEHLTMQIARQVYKLNIPANALIFFKDGSPAYLVKRFDQKSEGSRFLQEDFAQIAQITSESHGSRQGYKLGNPENLTEQACIKGVEVRQVNARNSK